MSFIEFQNVSIGYGSGAARTEVLKDINLCIEKGEIVAILGFSGTGKSTIVNLLAGLVQPDHGQVMVKGVPVLGPSPERGLVFQNYSLLPWFDVRRNIQLSVDRVFAGEDAPSRAGRVTKAMAMVNLGSASRKKPGELSGGMRQRVSVARTLAMNPEILLLDEPLSALDALTRATVQDEILGIQKSLGQTILLVTNDVDEALYMADKIVPLGIGPAATLGAVTYNPIPAGRTRSALENNLEIAAAREEIIGFLLQQRALQLQAATSVAPRLPDARPIDISRGRPTRFFFRKAITA